MHQHSLRTSHATADGAQAAHVHIKATQNGPNNNDEAAPFDNGSPSASKMMTAGQTLAAASSDTAEVPWPCTAPVEAMSSTTLTWEANMAAAWLLGIWMQTNNT